MQDRQSDVPALAHIAGIQLGQRDHVSMLWYMGWIKGFSLTNISLSLRVQD